MCVQMTNSRDLSQPNSDEQHINAAYIFILSFSLLLHIDRIAYILTYIYSTPQIAILGGCREGIENKHALVLTRNSRQI